MQRVESLFTKVFSRSGKFLKIFLEVYVYVYIFH